MESGAYKVDGSDAVGIGQLTFHIDFVALVGADVIGLELHLRSCAVDFRPRNFVVGATGERKQRNAEAKFAEGKIPVHEDRFGIVKVKEINVSERCRGLRVNMELMRQRMVSLWNALIKVQSVPPVAEMI